LPFGIFSSKSFQAEARATSRHLAKAASFMSCTPSPACLKTSASFWSSTFALSMPNFSRPAPTSMTIFCWSGLSLSKVAFDIMIGSNMNQKVLSRAVVTCLACSCRRKEISEVLEVSAASSTPDCIAL
jgi:hypothetical protein